MQQQQNNSSASLINSTAQTQSKTQHEIQSSTADNILQTNLHVKQDHLGYVTLTTKGTRYVLWRKIRFLSKIFNCQQLTFHAPKSECFTPVSRSSLNNLHRSLGWSRFTLSRPAHNQQYSTVISSQYPSL